MTFRYSPPSYTRTMRCPCGADLVLDVDDCDDAECPECGAGPDGPLPEPPPVPREARAVALTMRPPVLFGER